MSAAAQPEYAERWCAPCRAKTTHRRGVNDWHCLRSITPPQPASAPELADQKQRYEALLGEAIAENARLAGDVERWTARVNAVEARLDAVRQAADRKPLHAVTAATLDLVAAERQRQDVKWGRSPGHWPNGSGVKLAVLVEEVGEVARALLEEEGDERLLEELVQVAAVAVAWAETLAKGTP